MKLQKINKDSLISAPINTIKDPKDKNHTTCTDLINKLSNLTSDLIEETDRLIENVNKSA